MLNVNTPSEKTITQFEENARFIYITHVTSHISQEQIQALYTRVVKKPPRKISMFGKEYTFPRSMAMFGNSYPFSGQVIEAEDERDDVVDQCIEIANKLFGTGFDSALVNVYNNGDQYISQHSDDELNHTHGSPICTFSFGVIRHMHICGKIPTNIKIDKNNKRRRTFARWKFPLEHGSCAIMEGTEFQQKYTHGIPKKRGENQWRMSITVRNFKKN